MPPLAAQEFVCRVFVPGRPRTKGSLKPLHVPGRGGRPCKVGLTEDHALSTPWKKRMMLELARSLGGAGAYVPYADAVEVHAFFRFEREHTVRDGVVRQEIIPSHQGLWPVADKIGDEDKLRRNVLDALTQAHVIADDRLVIGGSNYKRWCRDGEESGVTIVAWAAPDPECVDWLEQMTWTSAQ